MPTKRRRHTITEVGDVEEALQRVRAVQGEPDMRELVVLGADVAVRRSEAGRRAKEERERLRQELIEFMTSGPGIDPDAAREARERGWARGG